MIRPFRRGFCHSLIAAWAGLLSVARCASPEDVNWEVLSARLPGVDGRIDAFASVGTRLYAGGRFRLIGGLVTSGIAAWDGTRWSAVGGGIDGGVAALLSNGTDLIAGGDFATAGGVPAVHVARWDGQKWGPLGSLSTQASGQVSALAEFHGEIYAGGEFRISTGASANYLARWNGAQWLPVGGGVDGIVYALHRFDDGLYVGGAFKNAGGLSASGIARWDGLKWSPMETGVRGGQSAVYALGSVGTNLFVGGDFAEVGGNPWVTSPGLARWFKEGTREKWRGVATAPISVRALRGFDGRLLVGGRFTRFGDATSRNVAELSAAGDWIGWGAGVSSVNLSDVAALEPFGSEVFCGGFFEEAGGLRISGVARWTGSSWISAGGGIDLGLNQGAHAVTTVGSRVYALGGFQTAGPTTVRGAAEWTGAGWLPLGAGVPLWNQFQQASTATDGRDLFVSMTGGAATKLVQRWDGGGWSPVGEAGPQGALAATGTNLYSVGVFGPGYGVARLEGTRWIGLGGAFRSPAGLPAFVNSLAVSGTNVYAGGFFTTAGDATVEAVAVWNGKQWRKLGAGIPYVASSGVTALAVSQGQLYVGQTGNDRTNSVWVWNGARWATLPGVFQSDGTGVFIYRLVFDGPDLYVGGRFDRIDGVAVNNVARWDGVQWHALGSGVGTGGNAFVRGLDVTADRVYLAGTFTAAGGRGSRYFAIWHKPATDPDLVVNTTGDASDADPDDGVPDVDLNRQGLQTTLRCAIEFANRRAGKSVIRFDIPISDPGWRAGTPWIQPARPLPEITTTLSIDATTHPVSGRVTLNGLLAGVSDGLRVVAKGCVLRGLNIQPENVSRRSGFFWQPVTTERYGRRY